MSMKIRILARTEESDNIKELSADEHKKIQQDIKVLGGKLAGICYGGDNYTSESIQNIEAAIRRADMVAKSGHHSVYDHMSYTLLIEGTNKMMAMVLNSLGVYATSERSARYTKMSPTEREKEKYEYWIDRISNKIEQVYPEINEKDRVKLATENARYMISVFTSTTMGYTVTYRQLTYIRQWMNNICNQLWMKEHETNFFNKTLVESMKDFIEQTNGIVDDSFLLEHKGRGIDFMEYQSYGEVFNYKSVIGDTYTLRYKASIAELAQAIRHRTIDYIMQFDGDMSNKTEKDFFIPPIIVDDTEAKEKWISDIMQLKDVVPQGLLVDIVEMGTAKNFFLKCKERLCGRAQLEIATIEANKLEAFISYKNNLSEINKRQLDKLLNEEGLVVPKCGTRNYKCLEPCRWGCKEGLTRRI